MRHDVPCVALRLRDGRTTTIPVGVLGIDKDEFVRELQDRLQRGQGLRPLGTRRNSSTAPAGACNLLRGGVA